MWNNVSTVLLEGGVWNSQEFLSEGNFCEYECVEVRSGELVVALLSKLAS